MASATIGFVGLGKMGTGIARRIQRAGHRLVVWNRTISKTARFVEEGATVAATPREAAAGADIVITCLMDDWSVLDATGGAQGIAAGLRPGAVHLGTTTISPGASEALADLHRQRGSHYIAGPVLGRPDAAEAGTLRTFLSGPAEAIPLCRPIVETYTRSQLVVGERPSIAATLKLVVNAFLGVTLEMIGESFAWGEKSGIDVDTMKTVIESFLPLPWVHDYAERIARRDFDPAGFGMTVGLKDMGLVHDAAGAAGSPVPLVDVVYRKLQLAVAAGMGQRDWSAFSEITRRDAGLDASETR